MLQSIVFIFLVCLVPFKMQGMHEFEHHEKVSLVPQAIESYGSQGETLGCAICSGNLVRYTQKEITDLIAAVQDNPEIKAYLEEVKTILTPEIESLLLHIQWDQKSKTLSIPKGIYNKKLLKEAQRIINDLVLFELQCHPGAFHRGCFKKSFDTGCKTCPLCRRQLAQNIQQYLFSPSMKTLKNDALNNHYAVRKIKNFFVEILDRYTSSCLQCYCPILALICLLVSPVAMILLYAIYNQLIDVSFDMLSALNIKFMWPALFLFCCLSPVAFWAIFLLSCKYWITSSALSECEVNINRFVRAYKEREQELSLQHPQVLDPDRSLIEIQEIGSLLQNFKIEYE